MCYGDYRGDLPVVGVVGRRLIGGIFWLRRVLRTDAYF